MGSIGSGRQPYSLRKTTEDYLSIDIRTWSRDGLIAPGYKTGWQWSRNGQPFAAVFITVGIKELILRPLDRESMSSFRGDSYAIELEWTNCNLGGKRVWFLCPFCQKKMAILYWGQGFGCRKCFDLAYVSEREGEFDKAARRAGWIRKRLGWTPGVLNPNSGKPKGMHWSTYSRLIGDYSSYIGCCVEEIKNAKFKIRRKYQ